MKAIVASILFLFAAVIANARPNDSPPLTYDQLLDSMKLHNRLSAGETWLLTAVPTALITLLSAVEVSERQESIRNLNDQIDVMRDADLPTSDLEKAVSREEKYRNRYQVIEILGASYCVAAVVMMITESSRESARMSAKPYASLEYKAVGVIARFNL